MLRAHRWKRKPLDEQKLIERFFVGLNAPR
jgi:hypothetical protein